MDDGSVFWQPNWIYGQSTFGHVNDDKWHHVAYVYDQISNIGVYIDGVLDTDHPNATVWSWPISQIELGLSHDEYWRAYDGYLDDFRIYKRKLTQAELTPKSAPVAAADLVGRYNFDTAPNGEVITVSWPFGTLQSAPSITGPWTDVNGANSSITCIMAPGGSAFYRLRL